MSIDSGPVPEDALEERFPWIAWRRAIRLANSATGEACWGCRFCIATLGLRGRDIGEGIQTLGEFAGHMQVVHGRRAIDTE